MTTHLASAIFDSHADAERAVADLRNNGVPDAALSVVTQSEGVTTTAAGDGEITDEQGGSVLRGILGGGALGAGLGVAALAIPGVGPLIAAGAIAASAVPGAMAIGAVAGAAAGTLGETLAKHGITREDADYYGDHLGRGGVLVAVDTTGGALTAEAASAILHNHGGHSSQRPSATANY